MSECQLCIPNLVVIIPHGINIRKRTCSIMLNTLKSSTILTFDHYLLEIAYYQGIAAKGIGCFKSKPIWPIRIRELADLVCYEPLLQAEWSFRAGWPLCLQEQRDHWARFGLSTTPAVISLFCPLFPITAEQRRGQENVKLSLENYCPRTSVICFCDCC